MYKVLIAEDEVWVAKKLSRMIHWPDYYMQVISIATDGIEALRLATEKSPDIIITDYRMPGMDGLALIEEYMRIHPNAACIVLSGYSEFPYVQKALRLKALDYLLKPIDKERLEETLLRAVAALQKNGTGVEASKNSDASLTTIKMSAHVSEAIAFVNDYYQMNITLSMLAEKLHLNESYLSDIFKRATNTTLSRYLAGVRIEKAKQLLLYTDYTLDIIASRTGFSEYRHFISTFKRLCAETPSQFRRRNSMRSNK